MRTESLYLLQIVLAGLGAVVALASFLSSALYLSFSSYVYLLLRSNEIINLIPFGNTHLVDLGVVIFFTVMMSIDAKREDFSNIYIYNLILFTPEVLSYSQVNYLNLIDLSLIFTPNRDLPTAIVSGLIIVLSSCMIEFASKERAIMNNYHLRGIRRELVSEGRVSFIRYALMIGGATFIVSLILLAMNNVIDYSNLSLLVKQSQQLVFGVTSFIFLLAGLFLFMNYLPKNNSK
jgi:hypothetical protein